MIAATGRCACGEVRYTVDGPLRDVFNCHCERCRRVTGHHMAATAALPSDVTLHESSSLHWYQPCDGVEYGFCATCGSSLFWRVSTEPNKLCISAGTLDQPTGLRTTQAWFVSEAGDYFERDRNLEEHDFEV